MNVRDFECRSYSEAIALLKGKDGRTVCRNTHLRKTTDPSSVKLYLYNEVLVVFRPSGMTIKCPPKWWTKTSKDRIDACLPEPWDMIRQRSQWYLYNWSTGRNVAFNEVAEFNEAGVLQERW